ncbi:coniferyl-alcohol dehydrogenase [Pseudonocardia ailaonensis]|uniref:Coniferyl-alcohol dehydrogenase n=1 Tax=Pseudonocardia ailaonensis TaxID=367279 RepID=A0ABN2NJJ8_9PSEU
MLDGKTIVVTGCSSGIGLETARELTRRGATVIGVDRNPNDELDRFIETDLTDPAAIDELVGRLPDSLDGLCNIAGLPPTAPPELVLKVNALAPQRLTRRLVPKLAGGASITNLGSLAGIGWADAVDQIKDFDKTDFDDVERFCRQYDMSDGGRSYFFSKEVLLTWTMRNRWTWRDRGIRMNVVSPGPVDTPILPDFAATLGARAEEDMRVMDRLGTPQDIAPVIAFLQSDASVWLRGANLTVDGGMSSYIAMTSTGLGD